MAGYADAVSDLVRMGHGNREYAPAAINTDLGSAINHATSISRAIIRRTSVLTQTEHMAP